MFENVTGGQAATPVLPRVTAPRIRDWGDQHAQILNTNPGALNAEALLNLAIAISRDKARLDAKLCDTAVVYALRHTIDDTDVVLGHDHARSYGGDGTPQTSDFCVSQLAVELHCSQTAATNYLAVGLDLDYRLPHTHSEFRAGRLTYAHAQAISETTRDLPLADAEALDRTLTEAASSRTPAELRAYARRQITRLHPAINEQRATLAFEKRATRIFDQAYGMGVFWMSHHLTTLTRIDQHLNRLAKQDRAAADHDDRRSLDQRRTDIAIRLLLGQSTRPGQGPRDDLTDVRTVVKLTMTADTLLGIDDHQANLDGYGPITATQARRLALQSASTTIRRIFTDPADHTVMTYDAKRYSFSPTQVDAIQTRHPRCVFPGCRTRPDHCDTDHRLPYQHASDNGPDPPGQTVVANGQPLCRRHHRLKTHGNWTVTETPDHHLQWTSPTGRAHTVNPSDDQFW